LRTPTQGFGFAAEPTSLPLPDLAATAPAPILELQTLIHRFKGEAEAARKQADGKSPPSASTAAATGAASTSSAGSAGAAASTTSAADAKTDAKTEKGQDKQEGSEEPSFVPFDVSAMFNSPLFRYRLFLQCFPQSLNWTVWVNSDVTVTIGRSKLQVRAHRLVLSAASPEFAKLCAVVYQ
jgi:hypothetical protein